MSDKAKKLTSTQIILIVGIALVLAAVAAVGIFLAGRMGGGQEPAVSSAPAQAAFGGGNVVSDGTDAASLAAEMQKAADEGRFSCRMNTDWSFPDGASPSTDAYVANSTANSNAIYFDLLLEDEVLYTSPKIPVGSAVQEITLNRDLDPGNYECVCAYYILNSDDTVKTTANVVVRITIKA